MSPNNFAFVPFKLKTDQVHSLANFLFYQSIQFKMFVLVMFLYVSVNGQCVEFYFNLTFFHNNVQVFQN